MTVLSNAAVSCVGVSWVVGVTLSLAVIRCALYFETMILQTAVYDWFCSSLSSAWPIVSMRLHSGMGGLVFRYSFFHYCSMCHIFLGTATLMNGVCG